MKFFRGIDFKNEPVLSVINITLYLVLIVVIYFLWLKITGHSPVFETIITALVMGMIINTFRYEYTLGKLSGEMQGLKDNVKESFINMKDDIKEIKASVRKK